MSVPHGDIAYLGLAEASRRLDDGSLSPVDLTEAMLGRIEVLNRRLNVFLAVEADRARAAARESARRRAAGQARGPLDGIPIAVKDLFWRAGRPMTVGAKRPPVAAAPSDATVIARLEAAGGVMLGVLGLHEFAYGVTSANPHHGAVLNPWATDRNPGGSSGGSGAALAAGLAFGALGSDTGGSVRTPASVCGIVGLKPTYGRVSRHGVFPLAWSLDHVGPMARRVEDVAILLEVIAGADPADPTASRRPVPAYAAKLARAGSPPLAGLRVGVPRGFLFDRAEPEVATVVRAAIDRLRDLGAAVREVRLPGMEPAVPAALLVLLSEAAAVHARRFSEAPGDYGADVRDRLEQGRLVPAVDFLAAQRARAVVRRELADVLREVDCLAMPTTPTTAGPVTEGAAGPADAARRAMTHFTRPFNLIGSPALSLPCGFTGEGLPVGLQLVGRPFEEGTLLAAAAPLEAALGLTARRPPL